MIYSINNLTEEFSLTGTAVISPDIWDFILPKQPDNIKYEIVFKMTVQARKHRKKRINKKWLKKYGYKQIPVRCGDFLLKNITDDGAEFVTESNTSLKIRG